MTNTYELIKWAPLDHCPPHQLEKPGDGTDAGFDIRAAEDVLVLPYSEMPYEWEPVCPVEQISEEMLNRGVWLGAFSVVDGMIHRKRYQIQLIKTGITIQPSSLMWCGIYSRSSACKYGWGPANSVGVIDYKYGGELLIGGYAYGQATFLKRGERVAQLVPHKQGYVGVQQVDREELTNVRGGFGSTGIST